MQAFFAALTYIFILIFKPIHASIILTYALPGTIVYKAHMPSDASLHLFDNMQYILKEIKNDSRNTAPSL